MSALGGTVDGIRLVTREDRIVELDVLIAEARRTRRDQLRRSYIQRRNLYLWETERYEEMIDNREDSNRVS